MSTFDLKASISKWFQPSEINFYEAMEIVDVTYTSQGRNIPKFESIKQIFSEFSSRDKVELILDYQNENPFCIKNPLQDECEKKYNEFVEAISDDDDLDIKININKEIIDSRLSIYNFKSFTDWLFNKKLLEIMQEFSTVLKNQNYTIFQIYDNSEVFIVTSSFAFTHSESNITHPKWSRTEKLSKVLDSSNFYNISFYELLPDDFQVCASNCESSYIEIFNRIEMFLSLIYLSNISFIDEKECLHLQLTGQLTKNFIYDLNKEINDNDEINKIYYWVYTDGNPVDKIIIARNIISLHCRTTEFIHIDDRTFTSIQSNFNLYLKNNVSQYLELKNKLAEFLNNITTQCGNLVIEFLDELKGNVIAYFTFIIAVYLTNCFNSGETSNIFSNDITLLTYFIILISVGYLIFCIRSLNFKLNNIKTGYGYLKNEYSDIFEESELNDLFKNDNVIDEAIDRTKKEELIIIIFWSIILVALFFISTYLNAMSVEDGIYHKFSLLLGRFYN